MSYLCPAIGRLAAVFAFVAMAALPARAELAAPAGETILTVHGAITVTNTDGAAAFDMDMLQAMPAAEFATSTNWTEGVKTFCSGQISDAEGITVEAEGVFITPRWLRD